MKPKKVQSQKREKTNLRLVPPSAPQNLPENLDHPRPNPPTRPLGGNEVSQALLQAFQSNLLSLVSHEVRTPLMGIINALTMLESDPQLQKNEDHSGVLAMARRNAERLQRTLASLLDLTEIDNGVFKVRMREIRWPKIVEDRVRLRKSLLSDQQLELSLETKTGGVKIVSGSSETTSKSAKTHYLPPVFGDPQKLSRAIDLLLEVATSRAKKGSVLQLTIEERKVTVGFYLQPGTDFVWEEAWEEAQQLRPRVAFTGLLQSEEGFVRRSFEGLGSELYLLRQIASAHQGNFFQERLGDQRVDLVFCLPELSHREGLEAVLASRAYRSSSDLTDFALALLTVPHSKDPQTVSQMMALARQALYRSTDSIYFLEPQDEFEKKVAPHGFLAILLDDCKPEDAEPLLRRIQAKMRGTSGAVTAFPTETTDPSHLFESTLKKLMK